MGQFVKTEDFKKLNVGFALDEGIATPTDDYQIFNGERTIWRKYYYMTQRIEGYKSMDKTTYKLSYICSKTAYK